MMRPVAPHNDADPSRRYFLAPESDPTDRYAAGYDGNGFASIEEAELAALSLLSLGGEWVAAWSIVDSASGEVAHTVCSGDDD